jgi:hypothetical protein
MNDDEIERLLCELPAPELPEAWGAEILATARREGRSQPGSRAVWPPLLLWTRNIVARNPVTSGVLATLWLLIFLFRCNTPVDPQERELLAHADFTQPVRLITVSDEIRLVEIAEATPLPRQIP